MVYSVFIVHKRERAGNRNGDSGNLLVAQADSDLYNHFNLLSVRFFPFSETTPIKAIKSTTSAEWRIVGLKLMTEVGVLGCEELNKYAGY